MGWKEAKRAVSCPKRSSDFCLESSDDTVSCKSYEVRASSGAEEEGLQRGKYRLTGPAQARKCAEKRGTLQRWTDKTIRPKMQK